MKIWFDADNGPHVLILRPLAEELQRRGHEIRFTARDRASTCELLDLYGLPYHRIGSEYGKGLLSKATGTLGRAAALVRTMRHWQADASFGHGSRALPLASRLLGVPSVTMYDYEWVNPTVFSLACHSILLPAAITDARIREVGLPLHKSFRYPGFKEELYLASSPLDDQAIQAVSQDLGLAPDRVHVLLRPPATHAHYHNPEAERILAKLLQAIARRPDVQLIYLRRSEDQMSMVQDLAPDRVIIPRRVYDGPSLIAAMDLVISGGGTMTREAAILGVPSYSFFRGRVGQVDEALAAAGKLIMLRTPDEVAQRLTLKPRDSAVVAPDNSMLVSFISDHLLEAARSTADGGA